MTYPGIYHSEIAYPDDNSRVNLVPGSHVICEFSGYVSVSDQNTTLFEAQRCGWPARNAP